MGCLGEREEREDFNAFVGVNEMKDDIFGLIYVFTEIWVALFCTFTRGITGKMRCLLGG